MTQPSSSFRTMTLEDFTSVLSSGQPVPGGGSASAVVAALAASLSSMVVQLSIGRLGFEAQRTLLDQALAASEANRVRFLALADEDATAYAAYRAARGLPRRTPTEVAARESAIRHAARGSAETPLGIVHACVGQVEIVARLAGRSNPHAASDLDCAALLLEAAARAAGANVIVNLPFVGDDAFAVQLRVQVEEALRRVVEATTETRRVVASGATLEAQGA